MIVIRPPAVAGMFYPAPLKKLQKDIDTYLHTATPPLLNNVRAIIVPHAGYVYSGSIAAFAYKLLSQQTTLPQRIYLMGPAHRIAFNGVAMTQYEAFKTPLGDHPLDIAKISQLTKLSHNFNTESTPHDAEHCLEVQIPFLQTVAPAIPVIPMLFGQVAPRTVGKLLHEVLQDDDLIIVSSDLSHFHDNKTAHTLDQQFLASILSGDETAVAHGEACGQAPVLTLMHIAQQRGWQPHILDYRTSGDITGDEWRVVGYAAVAYVAAAKK